MFDMFDMFGGMSVENKRTLTKDTVCIAWKAAKKLGRPHPKIEDDLR